MTTANDQLFQFGGVPVGGAAGYAGWFGAKTWFVDYDNGIVGNTGERYDVAFKYIDTALTKMNAYDVLYVRPRIPDYVGGDSQSIVPSTTTAALSIAATQYNTSLIGCGTGQGSRCQGYMTTLAGASSGTSLPVLTILAPYVDIENFHFKVGGMVNYPFIRVYSPSFGVTINNCKFNQGAGTTYGATSMKASVTIDSAWYTLVKGCYFDRCVIGVGIGSTLADNVGSRISCNEFQQLAASNYGDIIITQGVTGGLRLVIDNNQFGLIPSAGTSHYITCSGGTETGVVYNNTFATATIVTATLMTLNGMADGGGNMTARGWFTS